MARLIFLFLDGVGMGRADENNPFWAARAAFLPFYGGAPHLPDGTPVKAIDALLGVTGIPQSATGQTTLFTGRDIPAEIGQHKGSYPDKTMRRIIKSGNLLKTLTDKGFKARFVNAYPLHSRLFSPPQVDIDEEGNFHFSDEFPPLFKRRVSVTSCMMMVNRQVPFDVEDIRRQRSIFQDYSNRSLIERGLDLPEYGPETAAEILFNASREYDFILYEYFQTDYFAHRRTFAEAVELIRGLDRLLNRLLSLLDRCEDTLVLTSDHGNLEDFSSRSHTLNPVPWLAWGQGAERLRDSVDSIQHVTPAIADFFSRVRISRQEVFPPMQEKITIVDNS